MQEHDFKPILIVGTQRSGSNLLRLILNQFNEISAPHPPHILQTFMPLLARYGDLNEESNFIQLVSDVAAFVNANPVPWLDFSVNSDEVIAECERKTLIHIYKTIYELNAGKKGAKFWCCKSMSNLYYIPKIEEEGLKPIYVHLVRDGRDVAASFMKTIVGEKHPYYIAKQWVEDQETAIKYTSQFAQERTVVIKYEHLINNPQLALAELLSALSLEWKPELLCYYESKEAQVTADGGEMWSKVTKPVLSKNFKKYETEMSKYEIAIFEKIAGNTLTKHGYMSELVNYPSPYQFTELELKNFQEENKFRKEQIISSSTKDLQKREKQERILNSIKSRLYYNKCEEI